MVRFQHLALLGLAASLLTQEALHAQQLKMCSAPNPTGQSVKPKGIGGLGLASEAADQELRWKDRTTLRVRFLGGDEKIKFEVERFAKEWSQYANLYLDFGPHPDSDIRIAFTRNAGSWSKIGRDALRAPKNQPTMNFGWFDRDTPIEELRRTTLHEFGHALGFIHEHQSPNAGISWNRPKVYEYFARTEGWKPDQVDFNIFKTYSRSTTNASAFDPKSIMLYPIPKELTTNGFGTEMNLDLSETDKRFAAKLYPWTPHSLIRITNATQIPVHFEFRWQGEQQWRPIAGERLQAGWWQDFWQDAGPAAKFRNLEIRFDNGQRKVETMTVPSFGWRPARVGDYPDFNRGGNYVFQFQNGRLMLFKK